MAAQAAEVSKYSESVQASISDGVFHICQEKTADISLYEESAAIGRARIKLQSVSGYDGYISVKIYQQKFKETTTDECKKLAEKLLNHG